jgi:hypothetical protein
LKGIAPLPVTKTGIEAAIPHSTVQSMRREKGRLVVRGIANGVFVDNTELRDREVFEKPVTRATSRETMVYRWPGRGVPSGVLSGSIRPVSNIAPHSLGSLRKKRIT